MPDVRNCRRCGKVYNYIGGQPICLDCKQEDEMMFRKVKEYLYDNPRASISQVSNELGISVSRIKAYLKEGRLEIIGSGSNMILECENCGKAISTGRFCIECSKEIEKDFKSVSNSMVESFKQESENIEKKSLGGMRYLNKDKK